MQFYSSKRIPDQESWVHFSVFVYYEHITTVCVARHTVITLFGCLIHRWLFLSSSLFLLQTVSQNNFTQIYFVSVRTIGYRPFIINHAVRRILSCVYSDTPHPIIWIQNVKPIFSKSNIFWVNFTWTCSVPQSSHITVRL